MIKTTQAYGKSIKFPFSQRVTSKRAFKFAKEIAKKVANKEPVDQNDLFVAMITAAYQISRKTNLLKYWFNVWNSIRNTIAEENKGLVFAALRRKHAAWDDDLESDTYFALLKAIDYFNPWRGFKFSTYAMNVCFNAICRNYNKENKHRRMFPVSFEDMNSNKLHTPNFERPYNSPSISRDPSEDGDMTVWVENLLNKNLAGLSAIQRDIIAQRFPKDGKAKTYQDIGCKYDLSKERIRQIQNDALKKLREFAPQMVDAI